MQITVTGRHMDITETIQSHAQERAGKLERFFDRLTAVEVLAEKLGDHSFRSELICHIDGSDHIIAHAEDPDLHAAIDAASSKAERQLHDLKDKLRNRKHATG